MLDEEIDPVLINLPDDKWTVDDIAKAIISYDEAYGRHHVDGVGWDSEYVYKIDVVNKTLEKFDCGISDYREGDRKDEKTQAKYLERTFTYTKLSGEEKAAKIKDYVETLKILINATAKNASLNDEMKREAVKLIYEFYNAD